MRTVKRCLAVLSSVPVFSGTDITGWLEQQAKAYNLKWLLAHADDGVIWGRFADQTLHLSCEVTEVSPLLRAETLQTARLFAMDAELLLWKDGDGAWQARLIQDTAQLENASWREAIDEQHVLWGTTPKELGNGFTLMQDGAQGLAHAVPLTINGNFNEQTRPLRLHIRHYLSEDEMGFVRISTSRLIDLTVEK